jgi:hypothetical protein
MNKLSVFAAALVFAGVAGAQTAPLSRQAVVAELVAARANGDLAALQGEKGVEMTAAAATATFKLPAVAVLGTKPPVATVSQHVEADHGENAARELGDFSAPVVKRTPVLAGR